MSTTRSSRHRGDVKRRMEFMASISRSSGLDKDGDTLKFSETQQEYWQFVQNRLKEYWKRYPLGCPSSKQQEDARANVLIIFRKLREGIMASKRTDTLASEVYELSLRVSTIFGSPVQTTSTLSYLFDNFYLRTQSAAAPNGCISSMLIALLHRLSSTYPSQSAFRNQLYTLPSSLLPRDSPHYTWISSLAIALRSCNYAKVELLTRSSTFLPLLDDAPSRKNREHIDLSAAAVYTLVDSLRIKIRPVAWLIVRTAYREVTCSPTSTDTTDWLRRSLLLAPLGPSQEVANAWLKVKSEEGEVKLQESVERKWIISKPR